VSKTIDARHGRPISDPVGEHPINRGLPAGRRHGGIVFGWLGDKMGRVRSPGIAILIT